jgi:hypothetical protein
LTWGYKAENEAVAAPEIKEVMDGENEKGVGGKALKDVAKWERDCKAEQQKVADLERQVGRIIAGQDERVNWLKLSKFINDCLPRPNGDNLTEAQKKQYWKNGEDAWKKFQGAIRDDASGEAEEDLDNLVLINLEAVDALYTDDLRAYVKRLTDKNKALFGMAEEDRKTEPKGGGWIVEVRGFTYHSGQHVFLLDTFIDNLNTKRKPAIGAKLPVVAAPDTGEVPVGPKKVEIEPIKGNVSHVVLFVQPDRVPVRADFKLIKESLLMPLAAGTVTSGPNAKKGAAPPPPPPPPPGGKSLSAADAPSKLRTAWKPLGTETNASLNPKAPEQLFAGLGQPPAQPEAATGQRIRTEFIVLFIWREPTPSDSLKGSISPLFQRAR